MKTAKYYSSELSEVDRRGQDRYWDNIKISPLSLTEVLNLENCS